MDNINTNKLFLEFEGLAPVEGEEEVPVSIALVLVVPLIYKLLHTHLCRHHFFV